MSGPLDVVVIGGGQAGLAMGYHLQQTGLAFVILDAGARTGDSWRTRWDSLTLFTPVEHSALPGLRFSGESGHYPGKDEVAEYLESYSIHFQLPIRFGQRIRRLTIRDGAFEAVTESGNWRARQVVVATGPFQVPVVPEFVDGLSPEITQFHSSEYRNPAALPTGDVLVVGAGNSGLQIAAELAATRAVAVSTGGPATVLPQRLVRRSIFWWLEVTGAMSVPVTTRIGRRASRRQIIIGDSARVTARRHGIRLVDRVVSADATGIRTVSGDALRPDVVIWATGFRPDFGWTDLPVLDASGRPEHVRGVTRVPGLYFLGLSWLHTRGSGLIGWVGRDAAFLTHRILEGPSPIVRSNTKEEVLHA